MHSSFLIAFLFPLFLVQSNFTKPNPIGKYKVGDTVRCSKWDNNTYWEGTVVKILKEVVYQIELKTVSVDGPFKTYLSPSECTGKKKLSYQDGEKYMKTKIWVHERCLN